MQITFFHDVTDGVSLQNLQSKGVICKILQDKELRCILAFADGILAASEVWTLQE
jgi:hypothetical protein